MECWVHVFEDQARDSVWTRCFVVWCAAESFLRYRWGDSSGDHRDGVQQVGCNVGEPRERCSRGECGASREVRSFKLVDLFNNLLRVCDEAARGVVPDDREVCGERLRIFPSSSRAEDGLHGHLWFCNKHAREGFPIFQPTLVAGVFEE